MGFKFIVMPLAALVMAMGLQPQTASAQNAAWQEYRSAEAGFRVEFPGKPEVSAQDVPGAAGVKMYGAMTTVGAGMIGVIYSVDTSSHQSLDDMTALEITRMHAKLISSKHETVGGVPGLRISYDGGNGLIVTKRYALANGKIYQIMAIGPAAFASGPDAARFLNSFALIGK